MDIEAQLRDIISEREPHLFEVLHENGNIRYWRGPLKEDKLWTPRNVNSASTSKSFAKPARNQIDTRSIYAIDDTLLDLQRINMKQRTTKKDPKRFLPTNVEQRKEKEYIQRHLREGQPNNLTNMIMKHYFQAPKVPFLGYGMPRPDTSAESVKNCQVRGKAPGIVVVSNHKSLSRYAHHCQHHLGTSGEYCDILGPGSCSACIEETNRYIGDEIQRRLFPRIFMSQNCLVVPKLSRTMRQGHMKQVRKKRLTELSLPQNEVTEMFRRKETPLSTETYHSARPFKQFLPHTPHQLNSASSDVSSSELNW